eukprot:9808048-Lingulodinium_polyedra.AAC.1
MLRPGAGRRKRAAPRPSAALRQPRMLQAVPVTWDHVVPGQCCPATLPRYAHTCAAARRTE